MSPVQDIIQFRRSTASQWTATNPVLHSGELGFELDTGKFKIGDGTTAWTALAYASTGGGGGVDTTTIHAATSKATPVDADETLLLDSAASFGLKRLTWANLKATVATYIASLSQALTNKDLTSGTNTFPTFNQNTTGSAAKWTTARTIDGVSVDGTANVTVVAPATHAATAKGTPIGADEMVITDSAASFGIKKVLLSVLKTFVNTNATDPTNPQDVATKAYTDALAGSKLDPSLSAIATVAVGLTITVVYDNTLGWVLPSGFSTNANIAWVFNGGDEAHAPPSTTSTRRTWNRPAA